jgi:hypothetical protein
MHDPALMQALADRIAGLPTNGHHAGEFGEPLATLWRDLDAAQPTDYTTTFVKWAGSDQARLDLASEILKLTPGGSPPPDPWKIFTLKDAYQPRPPLEFLVEDLIVAPSLNMTYGAPGVMKSMLVADLCICVAGGKAWLPPGEPKAKPARATKQVPVLWCDFDNGKRRTDERFDALGRVRKLPETTPLYYVSMPTPWLDASETLAIEELKLRVLRMNIRLVVVDNLGTITGKAEENTGDMVQVMANLRHLAESTGAAVIIVHHQRKGNGTIGRAGETVRGHSSIEAALDLALLVEREEHSEDIKVKSTKTRDVDVFPFGARFHFTHKQGTKELETAEFRGVYVEDQTSDAAVKSGVIDALNVKRPQSQMELLKNVKASLSEVGVNRIRIIADGMVRLGTLRTMKGPHNALLYDLP